ncbi:SDR family oxidoreductase [Dermatobacter hominis]|uniref:SDR family oxidoreductase n=1 Tax=Dermatobacter hominis TaxID=2884263 RepID=UPI001D0F8E3E|nr:SDR family oxidoreductase [Dermatobacter hominis]UDY35374.1 SDR family oxidoreductase [Dermatobacter hominis]
MTDLVLGGTAALVTGGGSGIGLESARRLVADGAAVTIMGRTEERLRDGVTALEAAAPTNGLVRFVVGDAKSEDDVARAVAVATEATGGLDFAVASAGRGGLGPIITTPLDEWTDIIATNLTGTFLLFKHAGAAIAGSGGGSMVAISSIAAAVTHPFMGPYCVSKAGIDMLVRQTADELGRAGVRVNAVRPGIVETDLVSMVMDDEQVMGSYLDNMPVSRAGNVDDVGSVVRFLLGEESSWVTGTSLSVDGGHHLRRGPDFEPAARAFFGDDAVEGRVTAADEGAAG